MMELAQILLVACAALFLLTTMGVMAYGVYDYWCERRIEARRQELQAQRAQIFGPKRSSKKAAENLADRN